MARYAEIQNSTLKIINHITVDDPKNLSPKFGLAPKFSRLVLVKQGEDEQLPDDKHTYSGWQYTPNPADNPTEVLRTHSIIKIPDAALVDRDRLNTLRSKIAPLRAGSIQGPELMSIVAQLIIETIGE